MSFTLNIDGDTAEICTASQLAVALDVLQGQYDRTVLEQLKPVLAEIIQESQGLYDIFKVLCPEDQLFLIDALGPNLVSILKGANKLRDIFAMVADDRVEQHLINTLGSEGLQALVNTAQDLVDVLEWVYGSSDQLILELLGNGYLKTLFQSGYELSLVLHTLDRNRQKELFNLLGWKKVNSLIHDLNDLAYLSRALPSELSIALMARLAKDRVWELVRNEKGLNQLIKFLDNEEETFVRNLLEVTNA